MPAVEHGDNFVGYGKVDGHSRTQLDSYAGGGRALDRLSDLAERLGRGGSVGEQFAEAAVA
jgi:hypothetical protein